MKILALDLGTKCGFAYSGGGSGVWNLAPRRHESQGMRWIKFRQSLNDALKDVDMVAYEEVARHLGTHAAHIYGGFLAILQEMCEERKIEFVGVPVGTIKKFATGRGNASKDMMIKAANQLTGRGDTGSGNPEPVVDDNEADATCLLAYAKEQYGNKEE